MQSGQSKWIDKSHWFIRNFFLIYFSITLNLQFSSAFLNHEHIVINCDVIIEFEFHMKPAGWALFIYSRRFSAALVCI